MVTLYEFFLAVHILAVVIWVGGGVMIQVLAGLIRRQRDPEKLLYLLSFGDTLGSRIFGPASVLVLIFGILTAEKGDWGYPAWVIVGFVIWGLSGIIAGVFYGPQGKRMGPLVQAHGVGSAEVDRQIRWFLTVTRLDSLLLVLAIIDMVIKPTF